MAWFEDDKLESRAQEAESEVHKDVPIEDEEIDEFAEDDSELTYQPGVDPALDSVQIDVDQMLSEIAAEANSADAANVRVRKRLEAMMEQKKEDQDIADFDEYDLEG